MHIHTCRDLYIYIYDILHLELGWPDDDEGLPKVPGRIDPKDMHNIVEKAKGALKEEAYGELGYEVLVPLTNLTFFDEFLKCKLIAKGRAARKNKQRYEYVFNCVRVYEKIVTRPDSYIALICIYEIYA